MPCIFFQKDKVLGEIKKNNHMKKYQELNRFELNQTTQQRLDELRIFQYLLRHNDRMNALYLNKAHEIADGLQPWIDALEIVLKK